MKGLCKARFTFLIYVFLYHSFLGIQVGRQKGLISRRVESSQLAKAWASNTDFLYFSPQLRSSTSSQPLMSSHLSSGESHSRQGEGLDSPNPFA
ncbi:uncharacterized protein K460DRAFT_196736 [Cucurbitaria berberidis CBS 394.84]|uniref:Uncharacterized protein n=1 Tax=Cucurbitaria berberidis CBS 394.84 TaxID=1168544 RepID=A0A9P4G8K1_9PLEO|nr:uncharacterized protein K460DRAFT_196736 [Cucurbitaria berberidis CBS 394.84]KAF1841005.1 hypothetical protein K460DRAFT_196736 [Cucurbitaria berberidis CBS 394.84]